MLVLSLLCLVEELGFFNYRANDIDAFFSRLTCGKRDRDDKNQSLLASEFCYSEHVRSRNRFLLGPRPEDAREGLSLTFPLHRDIAGSPCHRPRKGISDNFKTSFTLVFRTVLVPPSAMSGEKDDLESRYPL